MESRALLAFALSLAILVGYQVLFAPVPPAPVPVEAPLATGGGNVAQPVVADTPVPAAAVVPQPPPAPAALPPAVETTETVRTDLFEAVLSSAGGRLAAFRLTEYRDEVGSESGPLDMVKVTSLRPLGVAWVGADGAPRDDRQISYAIRSTGRSASAEESVTVTLDGSTADGTRITKTLTFHGASYMVGYQVAVTGNPVRSVGVAWTRDVDPDAGSYYVTEGPTAYVELELEAAAANDLEEVETFAGNTSWAGYADHYFLAAFVPEAPTALRMVASVEQGAGVATVWADDPSGRVAYELFIGPKSVHLLDEVGHDLSEAVNLGWFSIVARPMLEAVLFLERYVVGNYGWAIILLTIGIRLVLYPVNAKQMSAMKGMQKLQPEIKRIQEKFKDDRERLNKEMMELYRRHKVNPLSGCLPMLVQLPVFIGLYNALMQAIELRHAPFIGWINDLSQPDRLGSLPIPFVEPAGIPVLTLLMGASMFIQQKMTPSTGDPTQQQMMLIMPVIFTVMFVNFPSGLVVYWFANNVLSIGQQYITNRQEG